MNVGIQVFVWPCIFISLLYVPRSIITGSYGIFLRNCQTVFHSRYTILHSHQQFMRVSILQSLYFNNNDKS